MNTKTLIAVALAAGLASAQAQSPTPTITPTPTSSPSPMSAVEALYHWSAHEDKSLIDDSPYLALTVFGHGEAENQVATLVLRYKEGEWDVIINPAGGYLGYNSPRVITRWDSEKAIDSKWSSSTDHKAAFSRAPKSFVLKARKASKLIVRLFPEFTGEETITFDVSGLSDVLAKYPEVQKTVASR